MAIGLGVLIGGIFIASEIVAGTEFETGPGVCEVLDCEAIDAEILAAEKRAVEARAAGRIIYLTFDDGPSEWTGELLDVLARYDVKATFFVTGAGRDDLISRAFNEGHAIGIHTSSHVYSYIYANPENFWADFGVVADRIARLTGEGTKLMRFPGGSSNTVSRLYDGGARIMSRLSREAVARGYAYFDWNVDSGDAGGALSADEVFARVTSGLRPNGPSVVLQHDTKKFSVEAVGRIIEYGLSQGYVFDKLDVSSYAARHGINN